MMKRSQRADVLGLHIDRMTMDQSVVSAMELIRKGKGHQHVVVNAAKAVEANRDVALRQVINECDLVNADGQSVVWASRLLRDPLPERVAGIDFMQQLWLEARDKGLRVYLLGARREVVQRVAEFARAEGVPVVGYRDGYWAAEEESAVVRAIAATDPDLLFVAIPSPRKERFLADNLTALNVGLSVGVGGSFDVLAGVTDRAPQWMQRAGLEWFYRLIQEPRRMFRRYVEGNTRFILLVARAFLRQK